MPLPALRLSAPGLDDLEFDPFAGWIVQSFDPGDPEVREVSSPNPGANGSRDTTTLIGPRALTLTVVIAPRFAEDIVGMEDHLKAFLNPRLRPTLSWDRVGDGRWREAVVRRQSYSGLVETGDETLAVAQWVAPSGVFESAELHQFAVSASAETEAGRSYDLTFDRVYPPSAPVGEVVVVNAGNIDAPPLIQLHGPWSGPTRVVNVTAGKELVFDNENVLAGNYVEIDVAARTVTLNGDPANGRYDRLVSPGWWELVPGENVLRFLPTAFSSPARMIGAFRDRFL